MTSGHSSISDSRSNDFKDLSLWTFSKLKRSSNSSLLAIHLSQLQRVSAYFIYSNDSGKYLPLHHCNQTFNLSFCTTNALAIPIYYSGRLFPTGWVISIIIGIKYTTCFLVLGLWYALIEIRFTWLTKKSLKRSARIWGQDNVKFLVQGQSRLLDGTIYRS